ncbi:hypothetical protein HYU96_02225 [Candidatus Daviesbacteria bacterium]|nr:hypothetical protein [Candidatus Daviesbacteria bacterium]
MTQEFENRPREPLGLPPDLFDNPAKYDGDIPLWRRTVAFVRDYQHARPQKRDKLVEGLARSVAKDPIVILPLLNNLDLVGQLQPAVDIPDIQNRLITQTEQAVAFRPNLSSWTPDRIEQLIRLGLDSKGRVTEVVQRLEASLFNAPRTVEEAVGLYYNATWAMVVTPHQDIREELFSVLCLEKRWLHENSTSFIYFIHGDKVVDDFYLGKFFAVQDAMREVGKLLEMSQLFQENPKISTYELESKRFNRFESRIDNIREDETYQSITKQAMRLQYQKNPLRFMSLLEWDDRSQANIYEEYNENLANGWSTFDALARFNVRIRRLPWPDNVARNPDEPLRHLVNTSLRELLTKIDWQQHKATLLREGWVQLTDRPLEMPGNTSFDVLACNCGSPEEKAAIIRWFYGKLLSETDKSEDLIIEQVKPHVDLSDQERKEAERLFSGQSGKFALNKDIRYLMFPTSSLETLGELSSKIDYHRPLLSLEQVESIYIQLTHLREQVKARFTRSVGRRGYQLIISDPALRSLGYETITFKQVQGDDTSVSVSIDGHPYNFTLDTDYRIKLGDDIKQFQSPQDQAWLELLTLSHLKKVMCTGEDDEELKAELLGGEKQLPSYRKQMVHRIEHLRRLSPGQNYSQEAFTRCLKSHLPMKNLYTINRMRKEIGWGGTPEAGIWTYVSGVERDIDTQVAKPVRVAFKDATEDMRKVIDLGAISQEELDRIEREILADLEAV